MKIRKAKYKVTKFVVARDAMTGRSMNMVTQWGESAKNTLHKNKDGDWGTTDGCGGETCAGPHILSAYVAEDRRIGNTVLNIGFKVRPGQAWLIEDHETFVYATKLS